MNEQSFADLLVPLLQSGYRLAGAMLHDPGAAEDVVQEASLIAWRKLPRLEHRSNVRAWVPGHRRQRMPQRPPPQMAEQRHAGASEPDGGRFR